MEMDKHELRLAETRRKIGLESKDVFAQILTTVQSSSTEELEDNHFIGGLYAMKSSFQVRQDRNNIALPKTSSLNIRFDLPKLFHSNDWIHRFLSFQFVHVNGDLAVTFFCPFTGQQVILPMVPLANVVGIFALWPQKMTYAVKGLLYYNKDEPNNNVSNIGSWVQKKVPGARRQFIELRSTSITLRQPVLQELRANYRRRAHQSMLWFALAAVDRLAANRARKSFLGKRTRQQAKSTEQYLARDNSIRRFFDHSMFDENLLPIIKSFLSW